MFPDAERVRSAFASTTFYGALDVSPRSPVRMPQPMQLAELPEPRAKDLVSTLYALKESDMDRASRCWRIRSALAFPISSVSHFPRRLRAFYP